MILPAVADREFPSGLLEDRRSSYAAFSTGEGIQRRAVGLGIPRRPRIDAEETEDPYSQLGPTEDAPS